ncbi:MAG: glycosyltransferase family 4 protein [Planctomycetes bacterium]|nr:glycosyltransferase family 4 protein [Planctomycetota bacterium]
MSPEPKIKVALFFTHGVSLSEWDEKGLLEREVELYKRLSLHNIEFTFFSYGDKSDLRYEQMIPSLKVVPIHATVPFKNLKIFQYLISPLLPLLFKKELLDIDLIKTNQTWGGWVARMASNLNDTPLLARSGYEPNRYAEHEDRSWLYRKILSILSLSLYNGAKRILVSSKRDKEYLVENMAIPNNKIHLHLNWIDCQLFKPMHPVAKAKRILFVGRLTGVKNIPFIIDGCKGICGLDILGQGEEAGSLKEYVETHHLDVNFLPTRPNDQLPEVYSDYPVYVIASHYEGMPKTMLEAMACQRAILGVDIQGITDIVEHEKNGLIFAKNNTEDFREKLKTLLGDEDSRENMAENARQYIKDNCSLESYVAAEIEHYKAVLN